MEIEPVGMICDDRTEAGHGESVLEIFSGNLSEGVASRNIIEISGDDNILHP